MLNFAGFDKVGIAANIHSGQRHTRQIKIHAAHNKRPPRRYVNFGDDHSGELDVVQMHFRTDVLVYDRSLLPGCRRA